MACSCSRRRHRCCGRTSNGWPLATGAIVTLGVPVGLGASRAELIRTHASSIVERHTRFLDLLLHEAMPSQVAMLLLQVSAVPRMSYLTRTLPPDLAQAVFHDFDRRVLHTFMRIASVAAPMPLLARMQVALPTSVGGLGLRQTAMVSSAAFWSAVHAYSASLRPILANHAQPPLLERLRLVFQELQNQGVTPAPDIFPQSAEGSMEFYGAQGAPQRLQAALFKQTEAAMAVHVYNGLTPHAKARLSSLRLPHSGTWLRVFPTNVTSRISNLQFAIACKQRLGIPTTSPLPADCPCCHTRNAMLDDPAHLLGCPNLSSTSLTRRHDALASHIAAWCNSVKIPAFVEPKINGERRRPDVDIVLDSGRLLIDVAVVHASSPTYVINHQAMTSAIAPLMAREAAKTSKYRRIADEAQAEFIPFVVSSFGGFGEGAMRLFSMLRNAVEAMEPVPWSSDPVADLIRELSMILQRFNSLASIEGCHRAGIQVRHHQAQVVAALGPLANQQQAAPVVDPLEDV